MGINFEKATRVIRCSLIPNRPYHVQWMITRKCNYRCRGCNVWQEQDAKELTTEEIKKGLEILKELGVVELVLSGGNPLLREDADEVIQYASRFFITTVYDNGSIAAEKIEALRDVDFVAISIDSLDPRKNDYIKGVKGAWKKAMQTVEKLHKEGIQVSVTPTISQVNLYEIVDLTKYFLQKGIPMWYCLYSYDSYNSLQLFKIGKKADEFEIIDKPELVKLCNTLIDMKRENSNILMTTKLLEAVKDFYSTGRRTWICRALQNFFIIDHLGNVGGCHLRETAVSIFELTEQWNSEKLDSMRKIFNRCTQCTYLCYIFYSLHSGVRGNLQIARDQWKNSKLFFKRRST